MAAIASLITSLTIVYSTVYSDADQRKHQSSASLAFVWGIHRGPVNSPHKWPVTRKTFPFDDVIMYEYSPEAVAVCDTLPRQLFNSILRNVFCLYYLYLSFRIVLLICPVYNRDTVMLWSKFHNGFTNEMALTDERHFVWLEFEMSFGWVRMNYIATALSVCFSNVFCLFFLKLGTSLVLQVLRMGQWLHRWIFNQTLTHLHLDKMAAVLAGDIFKCILLMKMIEFRFKFHRNFSQESSWQQASIGSGNGLAPNSAGPVPWRIYAALGGNELKSQEMHRSWHWAEITVGMGSANERRRYNLSSSLIGWANTQNGPCQRVPLRHLDEKHKEFTVLVGCFTNVSQAPQNILAKIHNTRNHIYGENFNLKICTCAQSKALGTRTKFQREIIITSTICAIHKFRENFLESSRNVSETTPWCLKNMFFISGW